MKKNFFAAALILSLGVGSFAACSSDDVPNPTEQKKTTTMMSIALKMPAASGTRAAGDQPYNYLGEWLGQEQVNQVEVFVFNGTGTSATLEAHETFNNGDYTASVVSNEVVFRPNKAIAVAAGTKQVYVVVNSNAATQAHLASVSTLNTTTLSDFELKYNGIAAAAGAAGHATVLDANDNSAAGKFAKLIKPTPTSPVNTWKNEIVMTGENAGGTGVTIADNVAEATAIAGGSNLVALTVKRVVARVAVTSSDNSFTLQGDDPYNPGTTVNIGKVSDFTYVVAQGERTLNFKQKAGADATSNDGVGKIYNWTSPANAFVSTGGYSTANDPIAADAMDKYDYAPLWQKPASSTNLLMGHPVPTNATLFNTTPSAAAIGELMEGNFVLPTTHNYNAAAPNGTQNGYYKGNTAYILIRTKFVPEKINMDLDPTVAPGANARPGRPTSVQAPKDWATLPTNQRPDILVRGANGMFYSTVFASQDPIYRGVTGQTVEIFQAIKNGTGEVQGYKMLYFAWVNPDNVGGPNAGKWYNSPVYRNNIYHVQLDGVTGIGTSWNPLVPATGGGTGVGSNDPNHPNNPDTFTSIPQVNVPTGTGPQNPGDPVTPVTPTPTPTPVQPQNPLTPNKTFMAVKTTVLPWQVHGYKFKLQNQ